MNYSIRYHIKNDEYPKRRDVELRAPPSNAEAQKLIAEWWKFPVEHIEILNIAEAPIEQPHERTIKTNT